MKLEKFSHLRIKKLVYITLFNISRNYDANWPSVSQHHVYNIYTVFSSHFNILKTDSFTWYFLNLIPALSAIYQFPVVLAEAILLLQFYEEASIHSNKAYQFL